MRLIDADELIEHMWRERVDTRERIVKVIEAAPTIEERKTGKWIKHDNGTWSCSVCQSWIPNEQHYYARFCPHCGAKMENDHE